VDFVEKIHVSQGGGLPTTFRKALANLQLLIDTHPRTMHPFKSGSETVIKGSREIVLSSGAKIKIDITDERLYHFGKGHVLELFSFANKNLQRPLSTFWPKGTTLDVVLDRALRALDDPNVQTLLDTHTSGFKRTTVKVDRFDCTIGIDITKRKVTQFFPDGTAGGAKPVSNEILAGIKKWFGL
ncbi:MAG TPA: hypothetical protein VLC52_14255, partial [Anaerolineae bacterium]|nr:hypothetical protein [Anaerolineae bacterium]